jgi:hypothetical protein
MTDYNKPQPPPKNTDDRAVWPLVMADVEDFHEHRDGLRAAILADMKTRHEDGVRRYGVLLVAHNGRDHAADAYQEALDGAVYWRAEAEMTGKADAMQLYFDALNHAWKCRAYLLARDGK